MPMHDWTRAEASACFDFYFCWLCEISTRLGEGLLPADYFAQIESRRETPEPGPKALCATHTPATSWHVTARRIVIRREFDVRPVALIELVAPAAKSSSWGLSTLVEDTVAAVRRGTSVLIIDPFPPPPFDIAGVHGRIWEAIGGGRYQPPADKPLTMASYTAGLVKRAYVEPFAVGDALTPMPLFLDPEHYVPVPLEESYMRIYRTVARRHRETLESPPPSKAGNS